MQVLTSTVTSNGLPSAHSTGTRARFRRIAKREQSAACCSTPTAFGGPACGTDVRQFQLRAPSLERAEEDSWLGSCFVRSRSRFCKQAPALIEACYSKDGICHSVRASPGRMRYCACGL